MNKNLKLIHKGISLITGLFLVLQSLLPGFFALQNSVFAQEETPTPIETIAPAPEESSTPTGQAMPEATPEPTVEVIPTEEVTPTAGETEPVPGPTSSEPPHETGPPETSEGEILDGVSTTQMPDPSASKPAPHVESSTTEEGQVAAIVLEDTDADTLDLDSVDPSSATLTTDKADYAPTDTVVITGTNFDPNTSYTLSITSSDEPAYSFETTITTDSEGNFVYAHQLDGTYRPNYQVTVSIAQATVASTTFTDSPPSGCFNDTAGVDDEPGQKDLTKACVDYTGLPTSIDLEWNWDEIDWPGSNTGDACALFDNDGNGFADAALCVTVGGNPAADQDTRLYTCNDTRADRCPGDTEITTFSSTCAAAVSTDDPFSTGDEYPDDTKAQCTAQLSDVSGAALLDVCSFPSQQPNSDPSDCIFASTESQTGLLEVRKVLSPTDDSGKFDLSINSIPYAIDAGNNGTTGEKIVDTGDNTFGEAAGTSTTLSDYTTTVQCLNAAGAEVSTTGSNPWTVDITNNADVVCTITNTRNQGTLQITKVVTNDNGGTLGPSNFSFQVNGGTATAFEADGQNDLTVAPGTYSVTEPAVTGYTTTYDNCSNVTVTSGGTMTCTITNDDEQATLTLIKNLPNDNGGQATENDFTVYIDATPTGWGIQSIDAGTYTVSEDTLGGYTASAWGGDCDENGVVTLLPGEQKTCEITNDDEESTLTLVKILPNDNGGDAIESDFTVYVNGFQSDWGAQTIDAGFYTISEDTLSGYTPSGWGGDCDPDGNVTLNPGDSKTCTIVNDDEAPTLTLFKEVINDNGGQASENDFGLTVGGNSVTSGQVVAVDANTPITLDEAGLFGYDFVSISGDEQCPLTLGGTVTLDEGQNITCTITNDDQQATLTLIKNLPNDNGGQATESDFTVYIDATPTNWGTQSIDAGTYTVSEDTITGYTPSGWFGDCDADGNVTLLPGDQRTCEITNDDEPATLTLVKILPNDNGGTATEEDFPVYIDEDETDWGEQQIDAGSYTISEDTLPGYTASGWGADCDGDGSVTLLPGESKTCSIVNDDVEPKLTVTKVVIGGTATVSDFPLFVDNTQVTSGVQNGFDAGNYGISETNQSGYSSEISGDCDQNGGITLDPGDEKSCTITNTRDTGDLRVNKIADTDGDGQYESLNPEEFTWGTETNTTDNVMVQSVTLDTGTYDIFENTVGGYQFTGWFYGDPRENEFSCEEPQFTDAPTNIDVTTDGTELTLCNQLQNPILTISKTNDAAGDKNPGDSVLFTIVVTATQSAAYNVQVTDLPAGGFTYRAGSWTATSDVRGDIKALGVTTEPTYASPGVWQLGDMAVDEVVTLTYLADISGSQAPGLYKDLVWAYGCNFETSCAVGDGNDVLATAVDPGFVADSYAGTQVNVIKDQQSSSSINVENKEEVLGASTELPATGANTLWLILAGVLFFSGIGLILVGRRYA